MHDEDRVPWVNGHGGRVIGPPRELGAFDRPVQYPETVRVVLKLPRDVYLAASPSLTYPLTPSLQIIWL